MKRSITPLTISEYRVLVSGIPVHCPNAVFMVAGQSFTAPRAVAFIPSVLDAVAATATAKGGWKDAILAEAKVVAQDGGTVKQIRSDIAGTFSKQQKAVGEFEMTPRKVPAPLRMVPHRQPVDACLER
jgi:hypothetical protein